MGRLYFISCIATLFLLSACTHEPPKIEVRSVQVSLDSLSLENIGDTVINDMVVKNPEPQDSWLELSLKNIKRKEFIESIFLDIYAGKLVAYDFFTGKALSAKEVEKIEKTDNYSRDIIGKFQFRESWFYDKSNHVFMKKVHSIIFGFETYDQAGMVKGYKPLFMVKF